MSELRLDIPSSWTAISDRTWDAGSGAVVIAGPLRPRPDDLASAERALLGHRLADGDQLEPGERVASTTITGWPLTLVGARVVSSGRVVGARVLAIYEILEEVAAVLVYRAAEDRIGEIVETLRRATPVTTEVVSPAGFYRGFSGWPTSPEADFEALLSANEIWC